MKRILLLLIIIFFTAGCTNLKDIDLNNLATITLSQENNHQNKTFQGYSLYLPNGLQVDSVNHNNVILKSKNYKLYLYVDLISYFNKVQKDYQINKKAFFSKSLNFNDKFGYLEINSQENEKYLVEIMYNYAKIEVIVDNSDMKEILSYALIILNSIKYNDTIIENMIGEDLLNYNELEFNIFETVESNNGTIKYDDNSSNTEEQDTIPDLDLIN